MSLFSLPDELLVHMCRSVCLKSLVRLRETCTRWQKMTEDETTWKNALFTHGAQWYQLKDVALAAKYMEWPGRFISPSPSFDTMDNVAFWGTVFDGTRLLATSDPTVCVFQTDIYEDYDLSSMLWTSSTLIEQSWLDVDDQYEEYTYVMHMYVLVNLGNNIGMYHFISGVDGKDLSFGLDTISQLVDTGDGYGFMFYDYEELVTKNQEFLNWREGYMVAFEASMFTCDDNGPCFRKSRKVEHLVQMEKTFAESDANAGHGWNNTRCVILKSVLKQIQKAN